MGRLAPSTNLCRIALYLWTLSTFAQGNDSSTLIPLIQKQAEALGSNKDQFSQDIQLTQQVTGGNSIYIRPDGGKGGAIVFKRSGNDEGKAVIVLTKNEDHLPKTDDKHTYVVLRQALDNPKNYYALYAYVRDATPTTVGAVDASDSKKLIEFDTWDHRGHYGNEAVAFGWTSCHSSPFIPCRQDEIKPEIEPQALETDQVDYPDEPSPTPEQPNPTASPFPKFKATTTSGFNVGPNYDLFADLDDDTLQAMFIGKTIRASAIGSNILEAAKPTLHNLFKKLAPSVEPQVGEERDAGGFGLPGFPLMPPPDLPAIVSNAKVTSATLSQVTQEFLKQIGVLGLLSDPNFASNKAMTIDIGSAIGTQILKGLYNMQPSKNSRIIHPNPALIVEPTVVQALVGGGVGLLQTAIQIQGSEAAVVPVLFQSKPGLSAIFDEKALENINKNVIPIITGQVKTIPKLPQLPVISGQGQEAPKAAAPSPVPSAPAPAPAPKPAQSAPSPAPRPAPSPAPNVPQGAPQQQQPQSGLLGGVGSGLQGLKGPAAGGRLGGGSQGLGELTAGASQELGRLLGSSGGLGGGLGGLTQGASGILGGAQQGLGGLLGASGGLGGLGGLTQGASGLLGGAQHGLGGFLGASGGLGGLGGLTQGASGLLGSGSQCLGGLFAGGSQGLGGLIAQDPGATMFKSASGGPDSLGAGVNMFGALGRSLTGQTKGAVAGAPQGRKMGYIRRSAENMDFDLPTEWNEDVDVDRTVRGIVSDILFLDLDDLGNSPEEELKRKKREISSAPKVEKRQSVAGVIGGLGNSLGGSVAGLGGSIGGTVGGLGGTLGGAVGGLQGTAGGLAGGLQGTLGGAAGGLQGTAGNLAGGLQSSVGGLGGAIGGLGGQLGGAVGGLQGTVGGLQGTVGGLGGTLSGVGGNLAGGLQSGVGGLGGTVGGLGTSLGGGVAGLGGTLGGAVGGLPGTVQGLQGTVGGLGGGLAGGLKSGVGGLGGTVGGLGTSLGGGVAGLGGTLGGAVGGLPGTVQGATGTLGQPLSTLGGMGLGGALDKALGRKKRNTVTEESKTMHKRKNHHSHKKTAGRDDAPRKPRPSKKALKPGEKPEGKMEDWPFEEDEKDSGELFGPDHVKRERRSPKKDKNAEEDAEESEPTTTTTTETPGPSKFTTFQNNGGLLGGLGKVLGRRKRSKDEKEEIVDEEEEEETKTSKKIETKTYGGGGGGLLGGLGQLLGRRRRSSKKDKDVEEDAEEPERTTTTTTETPELSKFETFQNNGGLLGGLGKVLGRRKRAKDEKEETVDDEEEEERKTTKKVEKVEHHGGGGLLGGLGQLLGRRRRSPKEGKEETVDEQEEKETKTSKKVETKTYGGGGLLGGLGQLLGRRRRSPKKDKDAEEDAEESEPTTTETPGPSKFETFQNNGGLLGGLGKVLGRRRRSKEEKEETVDEEEEEETKTSKKIETKTYGGGGGGLFGGLGQLLGRKKRGEGGAFVAEPVPAEEAPIEAESSNEVAGLAKRDDFSQIHLEADTTGADEGAGGLAKRDDILVEANSADEGELMKRQDPNAAGGGLLGSLGSLLGGGASGGGLGGLLGGGGGGLRSLLSGGGGGLVNSLGSVTGLGGNGSTGLLSGLTSDSGLLGGITGSNGLVGSVTGGQGLVSNQGLSVAMGGLGGGLKGLMGGASGPADGSFMEMAKDVAADAVVDSLIGGQGEGTKIGSLVTGKLADTLGKSLPGVGGLLGRVLGHLGGALDNTVGSAGKAVAGNYMKNAMKGAVKGGMGSMLESRKKRAAERPQIKTTTKSNTDLFSVLGWTGVESVDQVSRKSENHVFIGFGPCNKVDKDAYSKISSLDQDSALTFYLNLLRVDCLQGKHDEGKELLSLKYMELHSDKYFVVPSSLDVLKKPKLTVTETTLLTRAMELSSFSQMIIGNLQDKSELKEIKSVEISGATPTTQSMVKFALRFLTQANMLVPLHFVKVSRHMVLTLKSALTKSTQDYNLIQFNSKFNENDKQQSFEGVFHLTSLIHFYVNGLNPICNGEDVYKTYDIFLKGNHQEMYKRALLYCAFEV